MFPANLYSGDRLVLSVFPLENGKPLKTNWSKCTYCSNWSKKKKKGSEEAPCWFKTNKMFWLSEKRNKSCTLSERNLSGTSVPPDFYTSVHTDIFEVLQTWGLIYCPEHQHLQNTIFTDPHSSCLPPINRLYKTRRGHMCDPGSTRFYSPSQGSAKFSCALERERVFHQRVW